MHQHNIGHIDTCLRVNRSALAKYQEKGVTLEEAMLAFLMSAHEAACKLTGDPFEANALLQQHLRDMEQQLLAEKAEAQGQTRQ